jgi:hypothetical protein
VIDVETREAIGLALPAVSAVLDQHHGAGLVVIQDGEVAFYDPSECRSFVLPALSIEHPDLASELAARIDTPAADRVNVLVLRGDICTSIQLSRMTCDFPIASLSRGGSA